jgi:hypothetical protein
MAKYLMVDPPGGWQYGFPKVLMKMKDDIYRLDVLAHSMNDIYLDLLKLSKYPEKDIPMAMKHSRYWVAEIE